MEDNNVREYFLEKDESGPAEMNTWHIAEAEPVGDGAWLKPGWYPIKKMYEGYMTITADIFDDRAGTLLRARNTEQTVITDPDLLNDNMCPLCDVTLVGGICPICGAEAPSIPIENPHVVRDYDGKWLATFAKVVDAKVFTKVHGVPMSIKEDNIQPFDQSYKTEQQQMVGELLKKHGAGELKKLLKLNPVPDPSGPDQDYESEEAGYGWECPVCSELYGLDKVQEPFKSPDLALADYMKHVGEHLEYEDLEEEGYQYSKDIKQIREWVPTRRSVPELEGYDAKEFLNNPGDNDIAMTILKQLGGNKFVMMTGAKDLVDGGNFLQFKLRRGTSKDAINLVRITLTSLDLYHVEFKKFNYKTYDIKLVKEFDGIYADQLREIFESTTGLYTSLTNPPKGTCPSCGSNDVQRQVAMGYGDTDTFCLKCGHRFKATR